MSMFITQFLCRHRICFDNHHYQWLWYYRIILNAFFVQVYQSFAPTKRDVRKKALILALFPQLSAQLAEHIDAFV